MSGVSTIAVLRRTKTHTNGQHKQRGSVRIMEVGLTRHDDRQLLTSAVQACMCMCCSVGWLCQCDSRAGTPPGLCVCVLAYVAPTSTAPAPIPPALTAGGAWRHDSATWPAAARRPAGLAGSCMPSAEKEGWHQVLTPTKRVAKLHALSTYLPTTACLSSCFCWSVSWLTCGSGWSLPADAASACE